MAVARGGGGEVISSIMGRDALEDEGEMVGLGEPSPSTGSASIETRLRDAVVLIPRAETPVDL
jgi:hypothetical protein